MLFNYMQNVQALARDQRVERLNPTDMIGYINAARREIALRTQCLRVLTPIAGQIGNVTITNPGSGYTAPTISVSAPDFPSASYLYPTGLQAQLSAQVIGGAVSNIAIDVSGAGYWQPSATITDPTGTGCTFDISVSGVNTINQGQEVYRLQDIDLSQCPGMYKAFMVRSVALLYSNLRYTLPMYSFFQYQSYIRQYPFQYQYIPSFAAMHGIGTNASLYLYPMPSQTYQAEFDVFCLPLDLSSDNSEEAIPEPLTDAVKYYALYLCYLSLQNLNAARMYIELYDKKIKELQRYLQPSRVINPYGRP